MERRSGVARGGEAVFGTAVLFCVLIVAVVTHISVHVKFRPTH